MKLARTFCIAISQKWEATEWERIFETWGEAEKNVGTVQFISNKTPTVQLNSGQGIRIDLSSKKTPE